MTKKQNIIISFKKLKSVCGKTLLTSNNIWCEVLAKQIKNWSASNNKLLCNIKNCPVLKPIKNEINKIRLS
jgi:hypothetical protein